MTDERGDRPAPPVRYFPTPPVRPPAGPLRVIGTPPPAPTAPAATAPPLVARPDPPPPARHQLLVTLIDSDPLVWRRLVVPSTITLAKLHRILQAALGWTESHLHQFVVGDTTYGDPELLIDDPPQEGTRRACLGQVAPAVGAVIRYEYDFGDGWDHLIVVERLLWSASDVKGAVCLAGGGACPPEDCGGIGSYADLLATLRRGRGREYREVLAWIGGDGGGRGRAGALLVHDARPARERLGGNLGQSGGADRTVPASRFGLELGGLRRVMRSLFEPLQ